jgi:hypothetical protein
MPISSAPYDQRFPSLLDAPSVAVREAMDPAAIARAWAARLLNEGNLSRHQRQNLYDVARIHRSAAINRSAFGLLFELAPLAPIAAACYGPSLFKIEIVGRGDYQLPSEEDAHANEEAANHAGNLAQLRRKEIRTRSTALDLAERMNEQALASDTLALAAAARR